MKPLDDPPELRVMRGGRAPGAQQVMEAARGDQVLEWKPCTLARGVYELSTPMVEGKQTLAAITSKGVMGHFFHVATVGERDDAIMALREWLATCDPVAPCALAR